MERKEKIAICKKVLEWTIFKVRVDWFWDWIVESIDWVRMCDHDKLYDYIFNNDWYKAKKILNDQLEEHYNCIMESEIKERNLKKREDELRSLYLQN